MTADQLRNAEATFKAAYEKAEGARKRRNHLIRAARSAGWTYEQIAVATGLTRGRLSQIAGKEQP